jgi:hypothetical protein
MRWYGITGLCIMLGGTAGMFAGIPFVQIWMTPIGWTGFILFADAIVRIRTGHSQMTDRPARFLLLCACSILLWLLFELYNILIHNWYYIGLPENLLVRSLGLAWAFATIWPGIFEMRDLLAVSGWFRQARCPHFVVSRRLELFLISAGSVLLVLPIVIPSNWWAPAIWTGFILLLDPLNARIGGRSILRDLSRGNCVRFWQFMAAGLLCGILWEFWNYWSTAQWIYTVPWPPNIKIFEMPLMGWLGFPAFGVECFVMWETLRLLILNEPRGPIQ